MDVKLMALDEIALGLKDFPFIETKNSEIPVMGRIIIGSSPGDPWDPDWKSVVLEIGLEKHEEAKDYGWYWEISIRDSSATEFISKKHNSGYTAKYKPSCVGCSCVPMELQGDILKDFSQQVLDDISELFDLDSN
ncbi:MAG: hypothetical protein ABFC91_04535 [Methanobacteriaceae archaeon]